MDTNSKEYRKLHPGLKYAREVVPAEILKIIEDARLMPYEHQDPKTKKWVCGYSYFQAQAIIGAAHQQYISKLVNQDGIIKVVGSMPLNWDEENLTRLTLLNVEDVEKKAADFHPRDAEQIGRTYELKSVDADAWTKIRKLCDELGVTYKDLTESRREYARNHRIAQKQGHAKHEPSADRPTENEVIYRNGNEDRQ
jgi:hypothetical protein